MIKQRGNLVNGYELKKNVAQKKVLNRINNMEIKKYWKTLFQIRNKWESKASKGMRNYEYFKNIFGKKRKDFDGRS